MHKYRPDAVHDVTSMMPLPVAVVGWRKGGRVDQYPPPPPTDTRAPSHDDAESAGRASSFDAGPADRPPTPSARPPSGSAVAAAAADAGGVDTSLAAQLTAEKAVRDVLTSDDGSDSESDM